VAQGRRRGAPSPGRSAHSLSSPARAAPACPLEDRGDAGDPRLTTTPAQPVLVHRLIGEWIRSPSVPRMDTPGVGEVLVIATNAHAGGAWRGRWPPGLAWRGRPQPC